MKTLFKEKALEASLICVIAILLFFIIRIVFLDVSQSAYEENKTEPVYVSPTQSSLPSEPWQDKSEVWNKPDPYIQPSSDQPLEGPNEALPTEPDYGDISFDERVEKWIEFYDERFDARKLVPEPQYERFDSDPVITPEFRKSASLKRINQDGQIQGYQFNLNDLNYDLGATGFRDGDIIVKIGDADLRKMKSSFGMITNELSRRDKQKFTVLRNGGEVEFIIGAGQNN